MDISTDKVFPGGNIWLSINTGDVGGRARFDFPTLEVGWNHVIIDLNMQTNLANFGGYTYTKSAIKSIYMGDNAIQAKTYKRTLIYTLEN